MGRNETRGGRLESFNGTLPKIPVACKSPTYYYRFDLEIESHIAKRLVVQTYRSSTLQIFKLLLHIDPIFPVFVSSERTPFICPCGM
jgi:hypothetical protein